MPFKGQNPTKVPSLVPFQWMECGTLTFMVPFSGKNMIKWPLLLPFHGRKAVSQGPAGSSAEGPLLDSCHTEWVRFGGWLWLLTSFASTKFTGSPQNRSCWQLDHVKALRSVRRTHELLAGHIRRMNGFIECFFIMAPLAKLSFQTVKEEKMRSRRNKLGG